MLVSKPDAGDADNRERLLKKLAPIGQEHLLAFWDQLNSGQRHVLTHQIEDIDVELFRELQAEFAESAASGGDEKSKWAALAARAKPPAAMRLDGSGVSFKVDDARAKGAELLQAGQVGMILVAGGLGTRLGFDRPKGLFPLGPLSGRTLFQILLEELLAVCRRYGVRIPLYVMTSPATDEITRAFLKENRWFGLPAEDCFVFQQATMWAVDDRFERILLESHGSLFLGPDGHGGMLAALVKSGLLAEAEKRGIQHFFYGQIDNPLLTVCDEVFLGSHVLAGSQMTTQVVKKREALERVGNVVSIDGKTQVIEYSDLPDEFAKERSEDGALKLWAGNLAVHALDVAFLGRCAKQKNSLPFHAAHKKVPHVDETGKLVEPEAPNALRFEQFIFDLLPLAERALAVEVDAAEAFAPVKNSDDDATDNPKTARAAMMAKARTFLRAAGAKVADDVEVEVNPLWASGVGEAAQKVRAIEIKQASYLGP
jgi:UDP-N-acetylglucosamine/UDP-N-acetylgalactosamine diphosphorylase